jgi:NTE family protein
MATRRLAVVLSGGGARGALQAGALRALLEAGIRPELLVGTSIGAANAVCLALNGLNEAGLAALESTWRDAATMDLLPANYLWLTVRALARRASWVPHNRMRDFFLSHGLRPETRFADIKGVRVALVAADVNNGRPVVYGNLPEEKVLDGLLASVALPPWIPPLGMGGRMLMDGALVSSLPIEPAMALGATEIIALDLSDPRFLGATITGLTPLFIKCLTMVQRRESDLERQLAEARAIPVRYIALQPALPVPIWDFSRTGELLMVGYQITRAAIEGWPAETPARWWTRSEWLARPVNRLSRRRKAA